MNIVKKDPRTGKAPRALRENGRWLVGGEVGSIHTVVGATLEHAVEQWNEFVEWIEDCEKED